MMRTAFCGHSCALEAKLSARLSTARSFLMGPLIIMSDAPADLACGRRDARPLLGLPGPRPVPRGAGEDLARRHLELPLPRGGASGAEELRHHLRRRHAGGG